MKSLPASSGGKSARQIGNWRRVAALGYGLIIATFGIVGGWAAVAQIDQAVEASGVVSVETNRKTVQHFEGGIVREILAKEGESVEQGAVLFRMENVQANASFEMVENQHYSALAIEARLVAERDHANDIAWPPELAEHSTEALAARVMADQTAEFVKRRESLQSQVGVMDSRVKELKVQIDGISIQKASSEKQVGFIDQELVGVRDLSSKNLVPVTRLYSMERERERLEGQIGQAITDAAKAESTIGEYNIQIQQLYQKFQEDVAASLVDIRQKLSDFREKMAVAKDVLRRVDIVAPVAGTVQNLRVFTTGQVIRSGEPLLDIVPEHERLIVEAQISPNDIDGVYAGQTAEIRFPAFRSRLIPLLMGRLESVSRDRILDESSKQIYYRGIVVIDKADIPETLRARVRAGMPAQVLVATGERTVLSYFITPLTSTLRKALIQ